MRKLYFTIILALVLPACAGKSQPSVPGTPQQKLAALKTAEVAQITLI